MPGSCTKLCTSMPTAPIIAKRPCLSSLARKSLKEASSLQKPSGSKKPTGSMEPICDVLSKLQATVARLKFLVLVLPAKLPSAVRPAAATASVGYALLAESV